MFTLTHEDPSGARIGILKTKSGEIETPFFMPVATKGSIKYVSFAQAKEAGTKAVISNAMILSYAPGLEVIKTVGGIHAFMGFDGVSFTDSGGFQLLREGFYHRINDEAISFVNPFSGQRESYSPEDAIRVQNVLGSDVAMCLDDITPVDGSRVEESVARTIAWAMRCKEAHALSEQLLFGIGQGGMDLDARKQCMEALLKIGFDGYSLGGLCIGEGREDTKKVLAHYQSFMPKDVPKYLMGAGHPLDILNAIEQGVDIFDSTFPTQNGRHNSLFTPDGPLKINSPRYAHDTSPLIEGLGFFTCKRSRAYYHHQVKGKEPTASMLQSVHNIFFLQHMLEEVKKAIKEGRYSAFKEEWIARWDSKE
jgi:queuine tRNA-ribosyltransferase